MKPNETSSDYKAMVPHWAMITTILGGTLSMRAAKEKYLPRFPNETLQDYDDRLSSAKFTNIFSDIIENLASRPFTVPVKLEDPAPLQIKQLEADIDAQGNSLHVFAANTFYNGIGYGLDWILVDYTSNVPENATRAVEKEIGARPYWVRIPAENVIAVYSDMVDGTEQIIHARILETDTIREGFQEVARQRVRVLNREPLGGGQYAQPTVQLWELKVNAGGLEEWMPLSEPIVLTVPIITLVPFICGRRKGTSWRIDPPMKNAAELQIEHFQQESGLKYARNLTAFPMLAGNGVSPPLDGKGQPAVLKVGPKSVLYAPPSGDGSHGTWSFIEPNASSLQFLASEVKETAKELREIGRQPLTAQSGNLTVVTTAFAAEKGNSAISAWVFLLKDALELALYYTSLWLGSTDEAKVVIDTDFDLSIGEDDGFKELIDLRKNGDLSRDTLWAEAQRRGRLSSNFDPDEEEERLLEEMPGENDSDLEAMLPDDSANPPDGENEGSDDQ